jgi:uncharacterized protein
MIEQIIKLREEGLSFRKIAEELNTTVGKVQYRFNKWVQNHLDDDPNNFPEKDTELSENESSPYLPVKGVLYIKLVSPLKIIACWDASPLPKRLIQLYFNQSFEELVHVIRIYDVKDIIFNGKNAHYFHEISVPYQTGHWFINGLRSDRSYMAELGVYLSEKVYFPLLRSSPIQTPLLDSANGNGIECFQAFDRIQPYESDSPKWKDHVSTYSFYEGTVILEGKNGHNIIPTS